MTTADNDHAGLQALIDKEVRKKNTHHVLLGVRTLDGRVDFQGAAGHYGPHFNQPVAPDTPYFIASITKLYTAALILALADEDKLKLDAPIAKYLPADLLDGIHTYNGQDYSRQITVYQLLAQTSGLADYFEDKPEAGGPSLMERLKQGEDTAWDVGEAVAMARNMKPKFAPGAKKGGRAHYSDTNYQLLGAIIENVTGRTYAENLAAYITGPLRLEHTYAYDCSKPPRQELEPLPFYNKRQLIRIPKTMTSFGPDGGIVATLKDGLDFLGAFFTGQLFNPSHFSRMESGWNTIYFPAVQYGGGMMRFKLPRLFSLGRYTPTLTGHSGASGSFAFLARQEGVYMVGTFDQIDSPSRPFTFMLKVVNAVT